MIDNLLIDDSNTRRLEKRMLIYKGKKCFTCFVSALEVRAIKILVELNIEVTDFRDMR